MQKLIMNSIVNSDTKNVFDENFEYFNKLQNKTLLITGSTGVIGSFLVVCILYANKKLENPIKLVLPVRNLKRTKEFYDKRFKDNNLKFIKQDILNPVKYRGKIDYIIHLASNTSSKSFVESPIETMNVSIEGTKNILDFALLKKVKSMVFASSMEVYGELEADRDLTKEEDLGYINHLKSRSSYQTGKKTAESYASAYFNEKNVPVKIARLAQIISSNADYNDTRVFAYFARCVYENKNIILNTTGENIRSFCYITDAISAIFTILFKGQNGQCYNVSKDIIKIKDMAEMVANKYPNVNLKFELKEDEKYPANTNWKLDSSKLKTLGWSAKVSLDIMMDSVISSFYKQNILKNIIIKPWYKLFLQWIFSIKNSGRIKIVTLFGIPVIKIDRSILFKFFYYNLPIDCNKIVINNFDGKNLYTCNPKYIVEEIKRRNLPYKIVWLLNDINNTDKSSFPKDIKIVNFKSKQAMKELYSAGLIISNVRMNKQIQRGWIKKENQFYLQTWHGSLGIKKIGAAVDKNYLPTHSDFFNISDIDAKYTDIILSNSAFEDMVFDKYCYKTNYAKIEKVGHPRNDIFFMPKNKQAEIKEKIYSKYNIPTNKEAILYAPTFRDNRKLDCYLLNSDKLLVSLKKKFDKDFVLFVRIHPHLKNEVNALFKFSNNVINTTEYPDIQELMLSSKIMITDYSSCIFDFMLTRNPGFIFATDIDFYDNDRGFFYPLSETPFPVAKNNNELAQNILNFNLEKYKNKIEIFLQEKGCIEDGQASKRVVDIIEKEIKEKI